MERKDDNLLEVLRTLSRWKKPIIWLCAIAAVLCLFISFAFLDDYYQSYTVFYPASTDLSKPAPVGPELKERDYFGDDFALDRALSISGSDEVAEFLIDSFKLYEHYDIDTTHVKAPFFVRRELFDLYEVTKTKFGAVELSVEDKDPVFATNMVNAARQKVESILREIVRTVQKDQVYASTNAIKENEEELRQLGDSLAQLSNRYGIYNAISQSETLSELMDDVNSRLNYYRARSEALSKSNIKGKRDSLMKNNIMISATQLQVDSLRARLNRFNEGLSMVRLLEEMHSESREQLSLDRERLKQNAAMQDTEFPTILVVEEGKVPVIKSRPKRLILLLATLVLTFIFSSIGVLIFDRYRGINWREIWNAR